MMKKKIQYEEKCGKSNIAFILLNELPQRRLNEIAREMKVPIAKNKWEMVDRLELKLAELGTRLKVVIG
jgi:hypothetical protein